MEYLNRDNNRDTCNFLFVNNKKILKWLENKNPDICAIRLPIACSRRQSRKIKWIFDSLQVKYIKPSIFYQVKKK